MKLQLTMRLPASLRTCLKPSSLWNGGNDNYCKWWLWGSTKAMSGKTQEALSPDFHFACRKGPALATSCPSRVNWLQPILFHLSHPKGKKKPLVRSAWLCQREFSVPQNQDPIALRGRKVALKKKTGKETGLLVLVHETSSLNFSLLYPGS